MKAYLPFTWPWHSYSLRVEQSVQEEADVSILDGARAIKFQALFAEKLFQQLSTLRLGRLASQVQVSNFSGICHSLILQDQKNLATITAENGS